MAIRLTVEYQKRLGLPNYSSHAYSVTVSTEVSDLSKVESASSQLYKQLQESVDKDIKHAGYLPGAGGSQSTNEVPFNRGGMGGAQSNRSTANPDVEWGCTVKQRGLLERLIDENNIPFEEVDELAHFRFKCGVKKLNKMTASSIIDEIIDRTSKKGRSRGRTHSPAIDKGGK